LLTDTINSTQNSVETFDAPPPPLVLKEGVTMSGTLASSGHLYYMYNSTGSPTAVSEISNSFDSAYPPSLKSGMSKNDVYIDIRFATVSGSLYVSCDLIAQGDKFIRPGEGSFNFTSRLGGLLISAGDPDFCGGPKNSGIFYIAVASNNDSNSNISAYEFNITVSKYEDSHRLVAGMPVYATVPMGLLAVYNFNLPDINSQQISILLDCTQGDADLYVRLGLPVTLELFDFKSAHAGSLTEYVTISEATIADCAVKSCPVNIAVYGYTTAAFRLIVILKDTTVVLRDSVAEPSSVSKVSAEEPSALSCVT
jgi:hypothetical protein